MITPPATRRSSRGRIYALAAIVPVAAVVLLLLPGRERLRAAGPANPGHEQLACAQCHTPADGTIRQQVQANVRYLANLRSTSADFVHRPVGNPDCVSCHANEADVHPSYRFNEPRFAEVRAKFAPQNCTSCHAEHTGRRVTAPATVCSECHGDMEVKVDPIVPSHATLVAAQRWGTCMSCHDFHGNHVREVPKRLDAAISEAAVARYLADGPRVYGDVFRYPALLQRKSP